ncbi:MAG TPA: hypothetical protein VGL39_08105 [Jatrophihabitantaceae bacterium]|jgi:hypothetical protein
MAETVRRRYRSWLAPALAAAVVVAVAIVGAVIATRPHRDAGGAVQNKRLDVGGFMFRYPGTWHKSKAGDHKHPAGAAVASVFLASALIRGNCAKTSDGLACGTWPPGRLDPDGLVVSFAGYYGSADSGRAWRDTLAGQPASIKRGLPSPECTNIGGGYEVVAQALAVSGSAPTQDDELVRVDACLAGSGSDHGPALAAVNRMLATATFGR